MDPSLADGFWTTEFDDDTFGWFWLCAFLLRFIPRSIDSWSLESNIDGLLVEFCHVAAVDVHRHGGGRCRERIQFLFILVTIYGVTDKTSRIFAVITGFTLKLHDFCF